MARGKTRGLTLPPAFTRGLFRTEARKFKVKLDDSEIGDAVPVENSTKSLGWRCITKMQVKVGGVTVWVQVGLNCTVIGSGELPP